MEDWVIGLIFVLAMFVLMILRMHIGVAMGLPALIGIALLTTPDAALGKLAHNAFSQTSTYSMALGCIAAGGTMGILIPPSAAFVLYGIITEQSIGKLFTAGIIPGALLTILFWFLIYVWCKRNPALGPSGPAVGWRERFVSLKNLWSVVVLFGLVMGGIYFGIFNATEAAGVGVFAAFFIALIRKKLSGAGVKRSILNTLRTTGMIFIMVIGAMMFNYLLSLSGLTQALADFCLSLPVPPVGIIIAIVLLYAILGALMDDWAMMLIVVPAVFPTVLALGFDPIWFGVITVIMMEAGMILPPVGMNVFIMAGMVPDVPMMEIYSGIWPFALAMGILVGFIIAFPQIALFLPRVMM